MLVWIFILILILFPICYPISKGLDYVLGAHNEKVRFAKKDLKTLMKLHHHTKTHSIEGLTEEEIRIINSTIDIRNQSVEKIMVPMDKTFKLNINDIITDALIERIKKKNYSKIPIFNSDNICLGLLTTKSLITMHKLKNNFISKLPINSLAIYIARNTNLLEALRIMQESK